MHKIYKLTIDTSAINLYGYTHARNNTAKKY